MTPDSIERGQSISNGEEPGARVSAYTLDTAATLFVAEGMNVTPEEGLRLRKKIDRHILPLVISTPTCTSTTGVPD